MNSLTIHQGAKLQILGTMSINIIYKHIVKFCISVVNIHNLLQVRYQMVKSGRSQTWESPKLEPTKTTALSRYDIDEATDVSPKSSILSPVTLASTRENNIKRPESINLSNRANFQEHFKK